MLSMQQINHTESGGAALIHHQYLRYVLWTCRCLLL